MNGQSVKFHQIPSPIHKTPKNLDKPYNYSKSQQIDMPKHLRKYAQQKIATILNHNNLRLSNQLFDVKLFLKQNAELRVKLILELQKLREARNNCLIKPVSVPVKTSQQTETAQQTKKSSEISRDFHNKSRQFPSGRSITATTEVDQPQDQKSREQYNFILRESNQLRKKLQEKKRNNLQMQIEIQHLRQQHLNQTIKQTPSLKQKQQQIQIKSIQLEWLTEKNQQLHKLNKNKDDAFELYEKMCRRCEGIRTQNNKISQKLKTVFQKLNKLTGKQQNPNMFLMNLRV